MPTCETRLSWNLKPPFSFKDKTFGIKNKKGAKQQKFIQQVEKQVKSGGVNPRKIEDPNAKKLEKEKKLKEQKELALIFKPVQIQKIDKGTEYVDDNGKLLNTHTDL